MFSLIKYQYKSFTLKSWPFHKITITLSLPWPLKFLFEAAGKTNTTPVKQSFPPQAPKCRGGGADPWLAHALQAQHWADSDIKFRLTFSLP